LLFRTDIHPFPCGERDGCYKFSLRELGGWVLLCGWEAAEGSLCRKVGSPAQPVGELPRS